MVEVLDEGLRSRALDDVNTKYFCEGISITVLRFFVLEILDIDIHMYICTCICIFTVSDKKIEPACFFF